MIRSKTGLAMTAIRDDAEAANTSGINLFKYKFLALVFSSFFSGLAGGVFAYYQISIVPSSLFSPQWTFEPLVAASIGGGGTLLGAIIGSVFLIILQELFALTLGKGYLIIFGAMFIWCHPVLSKRTGGDFKTSQEVFPDKNRHIQKKLNLQSARRG